jgi:hypothetical protein
MTLCRFRHGVLADEIHTSLEGPAFRVDVIRLMQSVLKPQGAEHRIVAEVPLWS